MPPQRARTASPTKKTGQNRGASGPGTQDERQPIREEPSGSASLFQNLKEDDYILVKRRDTSNMKLVTHGKISPDDATEEFIQERWGGGEYQLQERIATEQGRHTYGQTRTIRIAGPYKGVGEIPGAGGEPAQTPIVGTHHNNVSPNEALNTALVSQVIELLKATRDRPTGPSVDWVALFSSASALLAPIITAMVQRPKGDDTTRMLTAFERMAEMFKVSVTANQSGAASTSIRDAIEAVQAMLEIKDQLGGGGERKPSVEEQMLAQIPMLIGVLTKGKQGDASVTQDAAAPAPAPAAVQPSPTDAPAMPVPLWQQILNGNKSRLIHMAATDMDPEFAAEMAVNLMPANHVGAIREFLAMPDHVDQALNAVPELRNFPKWIQKFFAHATSLMNDDDGEDIPDNGPTG